MRRLIARLAGRHFHEWRQQHEPLWGPRSPSAGYFDCASCDERKVEGVDAYAWPSWHWVKDGSLPPRDQFAATRDRHPFYR